LPATQSIPRMVTRGDFAVHANASPARGGRDDELAVDRTRRPALVRERLRDRGDEHADGAGAAVPGLVAGVDERQGDRAARGGRGMAPTDGGSDGGGGAGSGGGAVERAHAGHLAVAVGAGEAAPAVGPPPVAVPLRCPKRR